MLFDVDALWEYQFADNEVPADPLDGDIPAAGWLGPERAPFGTIGPSFVTDLPATTEWALGDALWLRRALVVDGQAAVVLRGEVKNACFIYLDEVFVGSINPTNAAQDVEEFQVVIPQAMLDEGTHQLAILCLDVDLSDTVWFWASAAYLPAMVPLWAGVPLAETIEWMTAVQVFRNSAEERERMRGSPRHAFRLDCFVPGQFQPRLINMLWGARDEQWLVPTWSQVQHLGAVLAGEMTLDAQTSYSEYYAGQLLLLWQSPWVWQVIGIEEVVDANTLALTGPTEAFDDAYVLPVRRGFLASNPGRAFNGRTSRLSATFQIEENRALIVAAPEQYLGEDIYWEEGLLDGDKLEEDIEARMELHDEDLGLVSYYSQWTTNKAARPHRMLADGPEEAWTLREWLHRRGGRERAFWQPSFEMDMRVLSAGALTTTLSVALDDYLRFAWDPDDPEKRRDHIAVETATGWLPREITAAIQTGPDQMQLTLSSSLAINASAILRVCFLGLRRLDTDRVDVNWIGGCACSVSVPVLDIHP